MAVHQALCKLYKATCVKNFRSLFLWKVISKRQQKQQIQIFIQDLSSYTFWIRYFDMDMSYARRVPHPKVLHQRTASHSSYILHLTSYTLRLTSYILHLTSYILHLTSYILHLTSYVLHLTPYVLHLTPYVLHLTSYVLRLTSYIISYRILYRVTWIRLVCRTYP
jgi:hypothetical protein